MLRKWLSVTLRATSGSCWAQQPLNKQAMYEISGLFKAKMSSVSTVRTLASACKARRVYAEDIYKH